MCPPSRALVIVSEKGPKGEDATSTMHEHLAAQSQPVHGMLMGFDGLNKDRPGFLEIEPVPDSQRVPAAPAASFHSLQPQTRQVLILQAPPTDRVLTL